jgi:exosortase
MATQAEPKQLETAPCEAASAQSGAPMRSVLAILAGALLVLAFWPILVGIYESWSNEYAYMEHGILVFPAAAYMVWIKRPQLRLIHNRPSAWGLFFLIWGALQGSLGVLAHWVWLARTSFLVSLVGCILLVYGFEMLRALTYPLCTLILMITPPTFIFERLTLSLQLLASSLGASCLDALGYSVLREGNILEMVGVKLSVEEACSGIRSLMAIVFMCVLYNYFFVNSRSMRAWILFMSIPIAILGNAGRIVASGIAGQYNHAWIGGVTHEAFGYVSVLIAAIGCIALHHSTEYLRRMWQVHG